VTSNRKKVYLIGIGVGFVALGIDRFMLPESATAPLEAEAAASGRAIIPDANSDVARAPIPAVPFPKNLPAFDPTHDIRDVFLTPSDALAAQAGDRKGPKTGEPNQVSSAAEFAKQHTLNAVLDDQRLKIAVVDGRWMKVGDTFDDCRLTTISGTAAHFLCPYGEAVLDFSDPAVRIRD